MSTSAQPSPDATGPETEHTPAMTTLALDPAVLPTYGRSFRDDIDQLHADYLDLAQRTARLAALLDHGDYCAAGGRARAAVGAAWRGAEELHAAFHTAPPRCSGPDASLARLCGRRMRYLAARIARRAE
ncbi:hypothetical protein [Streptomyces kanamyceticus]|uniref:Uncharacterized protein n=1 Tax=Streptomyces kanamyceticus TaxID=1967 RepID=Q1EQP7_STRKN|nr:hypothetical protein [Streptomyces kanamyceticus]BAE95473.1 hypothetical protein [Streptomyces kanamyceticus]